MIIKFVDKGELQKHKFKQGKISTQVYIILTKKYQIYIIPGNTHTYMNIQIQIYALLLQYVFWVNQIYPVRMSVYDLENLKNK